jgi:integrase/recombinase XerD
MNDSPEKISPLRRRLIDSARTLKARTALSVAYGGGLSVSGVYALKVGDIDSQRMLLRIEKGKGQKDRYALLPPPPGARSSSRHSMRP